MRRTRRLLAAGLLLGLAACAEAPTPPTQPDPAQAQVVPAAEERPARETPSPAPPEVVRRGDGRPRTVPGTTAAHGTGDLTTYVVQVEGGLGVDPQEFAKAVDATLADPRSWTARRRMQRVAADGELRIVLASPALTDQLCAPLDTGGYYSCANGAWAVVNAARWLRGAPSYEGHLEDYRAYVVNHEVGHTLGFGHVACPGPGQTAPVMLQQSKGLDGCARGPWPYP